MTKRLDHLPFITKVTDSILGRNFVPSPHVKSASQRSAEIVNPPPPVLRFLPTGKVDRRGGIIRPPINWLMLLW